MTDPIEEIRAKSDSHSSGPDYSGNRYPYAPNHVRVLLREVDRLRTSLAEAESKLAAVTAERDTLAHRPNVCEALDLILDAVRQKERAEAAESALAQAMAAMPSEDGSALMRRAGDPFGRFTEAERCIVRAWLADLDAFRASQSKAPEPVECPACKGTGDIDALGLKGACEACVGTGKRKGGEHG